MQITGRVIKQMFAKGSKSERLALFLDAGEEKYVLRRMGGDPYHDPELEKLVGKVIQCTGIITGYTLLISDWKPVAE